ncbi:MAG: DM13 domain-containing protein [Alphaproteobacteria bacterium GM202ARS2]|nr:DM13 domain-containing protein [Alphaproteobacteria bacterium GM202ARS2]
MVIRVTVDKWVLVTGGFLLGNGLGFLLGIFFFPFLFPPPEQRADGMMSSPHGAYEQPAAMEEMMMPDSMPEMQGMDEMPEQSMPMPERRSSPPARAPVKVAEGTFIHVNFWDPVHWGEGNVSVYEDKVVMHDDFEVGPGPKYHVYLSKADEIGGSSDVEDNEFYDLGQLRAFKGGQSYSVPSGVRIADYQHVVIWCEAFGVLISPAALKF